MQGRGKKKWNWRMALVALMTVSAVGATDYYVDGSNGSDENDGLSWESAKGTIQDAIITANETAPGAAHHIRVAEGRYPCFTPESYMTIEGGYPPGGGERDLSSHETVTGSWGGYGCIHLYRKDLVVLDGISVVGHQSDPELDFAYDAYPPVHISQSTNVRLSNFQVRDSSAVFRYACNREYPDPGNPDIYFCWETWSAVAMSVGISVRSSEIYFDNILLAANRFEGEALSTSSECNDWECSPSGYSPRALALEIGGSRGWVRNLTITGNQDKGWRFPDTPALRVGSSPALQLENLIAFGNDVSADFYYSDSAQVSFSNLGTIDTWDGEILGTGNISEDPMFVSGPLGDYYLAQGHPGEPGLSPCVDAGSDTAEAVGLDTMTTSADESFDTGTVDIGYHYPVPSQPRERLIRVIRDGEDTRVTWAPAPGRSYDVVRGHISELAQIGDTVDMGLVDCVGSQIAGGEVTDSLLPSLPGDGDVFFYVLRDRAETSGYGSSSEGHPSLKTLGNVCP